MKQLSEELEQKGYPPSIMMLMQSMGIAEVFAKQKVNTQSARILKSRIKNFRDLSLGPHEQGQRAISGVF